MKKDVSVTQADKLRSFAQSLLMFSDSEVSYCNKGISECDNANNAAEFWRIRVHEKVENAEANVEAAKRLFDNYESQSHEDSDGNSTYDYHYAAQLRRQLEEAQRILDFAKHDQDLVIERYQRIRQEVDSLKSELSLGAIKISENGRRAVQQVSMAASYIERYNTEGII